MNGLNGVGLISLWKRKLMNDDKFKDPRFEKSSNKIQVWRTDEVMSKLDDIWNDMQILMDNVDSDDRKDFKQAIKALMLELIGEDERLDDSDAEANQIRNVFRHELKAKVDEL